MGLVAERRVGFTVVIFVILQAAPVAAIIPLVTYLYGIGLTSKVIAVVIMALPLIVLNCYKGIRHHAIRR